MIQPVPESLSRGDELAAAWLEELRNAVTARTLLRSKDIRYQSDGSGVRAYLVNPPTGDENVPAPYTCSILGQTLKVVPGTTAVTDEEQRMFIPVMSKIDKAALDEAERPSMDLGGYGAGDYEVWVRFEKEESKIYLHPTDDPMPELKPGEYFIKIYEFSLESDGGSVVATNKKQVRTGHIEIIGEIAQSSSAISSDDSSYDSSDSSDSSDSKDTAIVEASFHEEGYAAWYVTEAPDVRFIDYPGVPLRGRKTFVKLDPHVTEGMEIGTLRVVGYAPDRAVPLGCTIHKRGKNHVVVEFSQPWWWPGKAEFVDFQISAIRRGFLGVRLSERTIEQKRANNRFQQSAYPSLEQVMAMRRAQDMKQKKGDTDER